MALSSDLNPELIRTAYRLFLGREPETELAVQQALGYGTVEKLRAAFLVSEEFRAGIQGAGMAQAPTPPSLVRLDAPPIEAEWEADTATADALLAHVRATWTRLGEERPHWSVLSADAFAPERIQQTKTAFFASGQNDCRELVAILARQGIRPSDVVRLFEFGCGVGRVTPFFAKTFHEVTACDVSVSHMALARDVVWAANVKNVTFVLADTVEFGMKAPFDVWFSRIVLQHNSPPVIAMILRRAFAMQVPGGIAVFQVPTYATGYSFRLAEYMGKLTAAGGIEMHVLPQPVIFSLARDAGCEPLEVLEDMSAGPSATWNSTTFVMRKRL